MKVESIDEAESSKPQSSSRQKQLPRSASTNSPNSAAMECHMCACPLFQPRPTCAFCQRGACSDHLRKKRKYPHKGNQKKAEGKRVPMDICDDCQDSYLLEQALKDEEILGQLQGNIEREKVFSDVAKKVNEKYEQVKSRLQAKELKHTKLLGGKQQVVAEVWEKSEEAHYAETDIAKQERELDEMVELVDAATKQIQALEAQPFQSMADDVKILETQNAKLTRELLKLDKGLSDLQTAMKKLEAQVSAAYDNWEKVQIEKKNRAAGGPQEKCVIF